MTKIQALLTLMKLDNKEIDPEVPILIGEQAYINLVKVYEGKRLTLPYIKMMKRYYLLYKLINSHYKDFGDFALAHKISLPNKKWLIDRVLLECDKPVRLFEVSRALRLSIIRYKKNLFKYKNNK